MNNCYKLMEEMHTCFNCGQNLRLRYIVKVLTKKIPSTDSVFTSITRNRCIILNKLQNINARYHKIALFGDNMETSQSAHQSSYDSVTFLYPIKRHIFRDTSAHIFLFILRHSSSSIYIYTVKSQFTGCFF